jgi:hypothetical protein
MFASEIWFSSPADLLGLIVTAVGIWLVVKQLNETRLASQMEGILVLVNMAHKANSKSRPLVTLLRSEEWDAFTGEEAHAYMVENDELMEMVQSVSNVYESVGNLVKANALDIKIAYEEFSVDIPSTYRTFEKLIVFARMDAGAPEIADGFEWIANKFEKMNS